MQRHVALLLLLAAVAVVGLLLVADVGPSGSSGSFNVQVLAPSQELFNGTVQVREATAYSVLHEASKEGGFTVDASMHPQGVFVHGIGGHENRGRAGWCYSVLDDGWIFPSVSADAYGLREGQAVRWQYAPSPEACR